MNVTITPGKLSGTIKAIPSKSQAHRLLICAAFSDRDTEVLCREVNNDIIATVNCLNAIGASIQSTEYGFRVSPIRNIPTRASLDCQESGSTLRFILPIVGALGIDTTIEMHGRLPKRPLSPLWEEMVRMGCCLAWDSETVLHCSGKLKAGNYSIAGNVSSQFISGLLFAMALIVGKCHLTVTGTLESKPYVDLTQAALRIFDVNTNNFDVSDNYPFHSPGQLVVEGDWSNAAFFLAANALGSSVTITDLQLDSLQGDRKILPLLELLQCNCTISAADIPDLVPIMAVVAGAKNGAVFTDIKRLRLKESDRVATVAAMLKAFDAEVIIDENTLTVFPAAYQSCTIDAAGDHRIAMAAAIAATVASGPVTICGAECVTKSYPTFWAEYRKLGGQYE